MKKLESNIKNMFLSLVGICIVVSAILAGLNELTKAPIEKTNQKIKLDAIASVMTGFDNNPDADKFSIKDPVAGKEDIEVFPAKKGDELIGYIVKSFTDNGFGGKVEVMVGLTESGILTGYEVTKMAETPGLGDKMKTFFKEDVKSDNIHNVINLDLSQEHPLVVKKDGGKVDAISAATISSRAFLDAINRSYEVLKKIKEEK